MTGKNLQQLNAPSDVKADTMWNRYVPCQDNMKLGLMQFGTLPFICVSPGNIKAAKFLASRLRILRNDGNQLTPKTGEYKSQGSVDDQCQHEIVAEDPIVHEADSRKPARPDRISFGWAFRTRF